jgi:hypothetical protein
MKTVFEEKAEQIGKLVSQKNAAYGSAFSEAHHILKVLYPKGIAPEQYTDALAVIRVIDKLFRIANKKDAFGENPWQDIAGYALLGVVDAVQKSSEPESLSTKHDKTLVESSKKVTKRRKN